MQVTTPIYTFVYTYKVHHSLTTKLRVSFDFLEYDHRNSIRGSVALLAHDKFKHPLGRFFKDKYIRPCLKKPIFHTYTDPTSIHKILDFFQQQSAPSEPIHYMFL